MYPAGCSTNVAFHGGVVGDAWMVMMAEPVVVGGVAIDVLRSSMSRIRPVAPR